MQLQLLNLMMAVIVISSQLQNRAGSKTVTVVLSAASAKTITIDYATTATDSFPTFTAADIVTNADGAWSVKAGDIDGDGDIDIVSGSFNDDTIAWYENDGSANPSFTKADIATNKLVQEVLILQI